MAIAFGRTRPGLAVRRYHRPTRANLGPDGRVFSILATGLGRRGVAHTRRDGDEEHKKGPLWIPIADGSGYRGEPLVWVSVPLVLDDLVVVQRASHDQGAEKGRFSAGQQLPGSSRCCTSQMRKVVTYSRQ